MRLRQLLADLPTAQISGPTDIEITSLAYDSRAVQPGSLFIAINGFHTDGRAFIPQALARGAVAVVVQPGTGDGGTSAAQEGVTTGDWEGASPTNITVENTRTALAPIAAAFYDHPGAAMRVIGITGTDGKTTTTFLTSAVLEDRKSVV